MNIDGYRLVDSNVGIEKNGGQRLDDSLAEIADFLTDNLPNINGENRTDNATLINEYLNTARYAFNVGNTKEAASYYEKIELLDNENSEVKFYLAVCSVLNSNPVRENMEIVFNSYKKACITIDIEQDWRKKTLEYSIEFADLIIEWFKRIEKEETRKYYAGYYYDTINKFYEYVALYGLCVKYMNYCFPVILDSDLDNDIKEQNYAFWFAWMCNNYCNGTLYFKTYSSSKYCGSLGLPLTEKRWAVEIYDKICFEVRKFSPDFEVCGIKDEYGMENNRYGFDRLDPPSTYEGQQKRNTKTISMQISKDKEIAQKIAMWQNEGGMKKQARQKRKWDYLSAHVDERTEYQILKREQLKQENIEHELQDKLMILKKDDTTIIKLNEKIEDEIRMLEKSIEKHERKIFGKRKARIKILELDGEKERKKNDIKQNNEKRNTLDVELKKVETELTEVKKTKDYAEMKVNEFLDKIII